MTFDYAIINKENNLVFGLANTVHEDENIIFVKLETPIDPEEVAINEYVYDGTSLKHDAEAAKAILDELVANAPKPENIESAVIE